MIGTLSQKQVADFRQLYEKHFGIKISEEEARERAQKWANFVRCVLRSRHSRAVISHVNENDYESKTTK